MEDLALIAGLISTACLALAALGAIFDPKDPS